MAWEAAGGPAVSLLFVQNADGGMLTESTLTLTGVRPLVRWYYDRPYRLAGQIPTEEFLSLSDEGDNSFAADFTCEVDGEVVNYVVELNDPILDDDDLSYEVDASAMDRCRASWSASPRPPFHSQCRGQCGLSCV